MKKIGVVLLALTLVFLTACSGGKEKTGEDPVLKVAVSEDTSTLDTATVNDDYAENIIIQVYDTLVKRNPDGEIVNSLAQSIENPDPTTYEIKLRDGVKFSNGDPLTVEDVIFTLKRAAATEKFSSFYGNIIPDSYEKVDDLTLRFKLAKPDAAFLSSLSHPAVSILSQKFIESGADPNTQLMGTGPFVLDEWVQNDHATFSRNENYWGDMPKISGIEMKVIPEASQRIIELESGGVDLAYKVDPNDLETIEGNEDINVLKTLDNSVHFVGFNMSKPPFDNKAAREAMINAIDMNSIFETVYLNSGKLATSPINPNFKYSIADDIKPNEVNKDKAKELFQQAGVSEGTTLSLYTSDNTQRVNVATMMQDQLSEYGINLEVNRLEWGAFIDALKASEHNMFIMSWNPSIVDAHYELLQPFHSSNSGNGPNYMYYTNPELDKLIEEGIATLDENERAEIYKKAQEMVNEDMPMLYICYGETIVASNKNVEGLKLLPKYPQELKDVTIAAE